MFVLGGAGWPRRRLPAATWPHLTTSGSVFDLPKLRVSAFEVMVLWLAGFMPRVLGLRDFSGAGHLGFNVH